MKINDWNVAGQLWAALTEIQNFCREQCRLLGVGPQILVWLNTAQGKEALSRAVATIVTAWKLELGRGSNCSMVRIENDSFESLVKLCFLGGKDIGINDQSFPSNPSNMSNMGQIIEFVEIATDVPLKSGQEGELLAHCGLRAAEPVEFLQWLKKNQEAGILTPIFCPCPNKQDNYMYCGISGGEGRGLHTARPRPDGMWSPATVFLGVKL